MQSYFKGSIWTSAWIKITNLLLLIFTLGLAYPWTVVRSYRWELENTVIDGQRLVFSGSAINLFAHWLKWWFLTFITLGIYGFWVHIKILEWKARHTHFVPK